MNRNTTKDSDRMHVVKEVLRRNRIPNQINTMFENELQFRSKIGRSDLKWNKVVFTEIKFHLLGSAC